MTALLANREEWLKMRKNHIGASDAPVIMNGIHFETTPYRLWEEKLGLRPEREDSWQLRQGRRTEEPARQKYEQMTNSLMMPEIVFHKQHKFMMATLDGLSPNGDMAVEIKCPGERDHEEAKRGKIPQKYYAQVQHQLACLDLNLLHYFSYRDSEGVIVEVERDEAFIDEMYSKEGAFWKQVLNLEAPSLTEKDFVNLETSAEWRLAAREWSRTQAQLKELEEKEKEYRNRLIALADNQNSIGSGVRVTKVIRKGTVDYKAIPELKGVDLEPYRKKAVECWRLGSC